MWKVYRKSGTDGNYRNFKTVVNAATAEMRKSQKAFESKLVSNIKTDSKRFYAYIKSH